MASTSEDEDQGIIRCICEFTHDDGFTIQCEQCFVWQHAACVEIDQNNVPEKYLCEECYPRYLDHRRAHEYQLGLIQEDKQKRKLHKKRTPGKPGRKPSNPYGLSNPTSTTSLTNTVGRRKKYKTKNSPSFIDVPSSRVSSDEFGPSEFVTYSSRKVHIFVEEVCSKLRKLHPSLTREDIHSEHSTPRENIMAEEDLESCLSLISEEDLKSIIIVNDINPTPLPQISSSSLNGSTGPRAPRGLFIKEEVEPGRLVMECKGELSFKSQYKQNIGNLYLVLGTPQPQVLFHPNFDLILDCRGQHHPSKFIRNKCISNAELRTFVRTSGDVNTLHLGIFATKTIEAGEEVCVPWSFCQEIFPLGFPFANPEQLKTNSITSFETAYSLDGLNLRSDHFDTLLRQIKRDNCYCSEVDDCVVNQFFQYRRVFWDSRPRPRSRRRSTSFSVDKFPKKSYPTATDFTGTSRLLSSRVGSPDSDARSGDYTPTESHHGKFSNSPESKINSPIEAKPVLEEKKVHRRPGRPSKSSKLAAKNLTKKVRSSSFIEPSKNKVKLEVELFGSVDNNQLLYDSGKSTHSSPLDVVQTPDPPLSTTIPLIPCSVFNKNEYSSLGLKKYWKTKYMVQVQKQTKSDLQSGVVIDPIDVEDISLTVVETETEIEVQKTSIKTHRSPGKHVSPIKRTAENPSHSPKPVSEPKSPKLSSLNSNAPNSTLEEDTRFSSKHAVSTGNIPSKRRNSQIDLVSSEPVESFNKQPNQGSPTPSKYSSLPKYPKYNDDETPSSNFRGSSKGHDSGYSGNSFYSKPNHYKREYPNGSSHRIRSPSHDNPSRLAAHKSPHLTHSINQHPSNWGNPNVGSNNDHREGNDYERRHNGWSDRFGDDTYSSKKKMNSSHFGSNRSYNDWNKIPSNHSSSRPYKYSNGHHNDTFSSDWNSHSRSTQSHHRYATPHGDMRPNIRNPMKLPHKYSRPISHTDNYSPPHQSDVNTNTYS